MPLLHGKCTLKLLSIAYDFTKLKSNVLLERKKAMLLFRISAFMNPPEFTNSLAGQVALRMMYI